MTLLTLFTSPKPFTNPHIATIQRNALANWRALGSEVAVIVLGDEAGAAEAAAEFGALHLPDVARNAEGTPLLSDLFRQAHEHSDSPLLAYVNADILLLPDFVQTARVVSQQRKNFLVVGQRWDLDVTEPLQFSDGWDSAFKQRAQQQGKLHSPGGSDYFIFPHNAYRDIPDFAIGRAGWDNWMIYAARRNGWATIDATRDIFIIHQNHDYSHLPDGQAHYRLPETFENVRLAGGRLITRFTLADCDQQVVGGKIQSTSLSGQRMLREVETFPLRQIKSIPLGKVFDSVFHPIRAYREFRKRLRESRGS